MTIRFVCGLTLFAIWAGQCLAQDKLGSAVAGLQRRYGAVETVTAAFQQTYRAPGIEQVESGILWIKKPGLMRWEYQKPEPKLFVADGKQIYLYVPEDHQVQVRSFHATDLHNTPLQFLLGQGDIQQSFAVSWESEVKPRTADSLLLHLVPLNTQQEYSFLTLECDARTYDLRRIVIRERLGNTSEFLFTDLKTNVKTDAKRFEFKIPKGVEVIRLEDK